MRHEQLAAQLYTVRQFTQTPEDIAKTFKRISDIGYPAVQVSGMGAIENDQLLDLLDKYRLKLGAMHQPSAKILDESEQVAQKLTALQCPHVAYPHPGNISFDTLESVTEFARKLDSAGQKLRQAGVTLSYHNHGIEFRRLDGQTVLEIIFSEAKPENLKAELDTYWVQYGGGNPAVWIRKMNGRLPLLHLKDYTFTRDNKPFYAEIGYGNLDWDEIIPAADEAGCEWFIVEQDECERDPFDSLAMSYKYLAARAKD